MIKNAIAVPLAGLMLAASLPAAAHPVAAQARYGYYHRPHVVYVRPVYYPRPAYRPLVVHPRPVVVQPVDRNVALGLLVGAAAGAVIAHELSR